jgi:hypothetical protein
VSRTRPDLRGCQRIVTQCNSETGFKTVAFVRSAILPAGVYEREPISR